MPDRYNQPQEGATDWGLDLNENFAALDINVEHRGPDAEKENITPADGAMYRATDAGTIYLGDGSSWVKFDIDVGAVSADTVSAGSVNAGEIHAEYDPVANVKAHGAEGDGSTDDSAAIQSAVDALPAEGGVVEFSPGIYIAEGIEVEGNTTFAANGGRVTLRLPAGPSDHLIKAAAGLDEMHGGGVSGLELDGGGTTTYDGIHFDDISRGEDYYLEKCYIHDFRRGYSGTNRDRFMHLSRNRFWNNEVGAYVNSDHPKLAENDFRLNGTGLGGDPYDLQSTGDKFNYNDYGIRALDGGSVQKATFENPMFFRNGTVGAELGNSCTISGGQIVPESTADDIGVRITGSYCTVSNVLFRARATSGFGDAAIVGNSAVDNASVNGCMAENIGALVRLKGTASRFWSISNNVWRSNHSSHQAIVGDDEVHNSTISDNVFMVDTDTVDSNLIDIPTSVWGLVITGNNIYYNTAQSGTAYAINLDARYGIVRNNRIRRSAGINYTNSNSDTIPQEADLGTENVLHI